MKKYLTIAASLLLLASTVGIPYFAKALSVGVDRYQVGAERLLYPTDKFLFGASSTTTNATVEVAGSIATSGWLLSTTTTVCASGCQYSSIQTALDAGYLHVVVKPGTYNEQITIQNAKTVLEGDSQATIIQCNGITQSPCISTNAKSQVVLRGFAYRELNGTLNGIGIDYSNSATSLIDNVRGSNFATSTYAHDTANNTFYNVIQNSAFFGTSACYDIGGTLANDNQYLNNRCQPMATFFPTFGAFIVNAQVLTFHADDFEGTTTGNQTGVYINPTSRSINLENPYIEAVGTGITVADGAKNTTVTGGQIVGATNDLGNIATTTSFYNLYQSDQLPHQYTSISAATSTDFAITNITNCNLTSALTTDSNGNILCGTVGGNSSFGQSWGIISGLFGANVLSPTTTIPIYVPSTSTSTIANLGGVLDATTCTGADIGAKFNSCYAALPQGGGTIDIPRGTYTFTNEMIAGTFSKPVILNCDLGTTLIWAGSATSTNFNFGQSSATNAAINNCHFYGPGTTTLSVAVELGGANGVRNFTMNNVQIENFGSSGAVQTGSNTYLINFNNDFVHHNGKAFFDMRGSNQGESFVFNGGTWADCKATASNCIDFSVQSSASSIRFFGTSLDDAQLHIGAIVRSVYLSGVHIENPAGDNIAAYTPIVIDNSANTNVTIVGTAFLNGANTSRPSQFISNGGQLTLQGITVEDYGGGSKGIADFVTNTGNGWTKVYSINKQDSAYTTLYNSTGGTGTLQYAMEDTGNLGINTVATLGMIQIKQPTDSSSNGLTIVNNAVTGSARLWEDTSNNARIDSGSAGATSILLNGSTAASLGTGRVGIGTTSPFALLSINANNGVFQGTLFAIGSSTLTATTTLFAIDNVGHFNYKAASSTCGAGCNNIVGNDDGGTVTTGTAVTAVTVNFGSPWRQAPVCIVTDSSTSVSADVSSVSTTAFTVGLSIGLTGTIYYHCANYQ